MTVATIGLTAACLVWAGMVIGISFLEAPVKFRAPSLTRAVGLDVGRYVFGALGYVEIGWSLVTIVLLVLSDTGFVWLWAGLGLVWIIIGAQRLWLWPVLHEHTRHVIAGEEPPATYHHVAYIGSELIKVLLLLGLGIALLNPV